jgi:hypothetical protein
MCDAFLLRTHSDILLTYFVKGLCPWQHYSVVTELSSALRAAGRYSSTSGIYVLIRTHMEERRGAYKVLVWKTEGKGPFKRPRLR